MARNKTQRYIYTSDRKINALLNKLVQEVRLFTEGQLEHITMLTDIGLALSTEKNLSKLLEMITDEAVNFTHADGGALYILNARQQQLDFAIVQNRSLGIKMGGAGNSMIWPPVPLYTKDGRPNHANVSAYCALEAKVVNIPDVYHAAGFNFAGTRQFDRNTGYRSVSMLVIPLLNHENDVIGVLQLINARDRQGNIIPFSQECEALTTSLASQAAIALTNACLISDLETLFETFLQIITATIDERSPYTGGHVKRVVALSMAIACQINRATEGVYANVSFTEEEIKELRIAAWMHDIGKLVIPDNIIDKATKLEKRLETVRMRFEILKRELRLAYQEQQIQALQGNSEPPDPQLLARELAQLEEEYEFIARVNQGVEYLQDEQVARIVQIAKRSWQEHGQAVPLLTAQEVHQLSVRRGTLTAEEIQVIQSHAQATIRILEKLNFPKKLQNVPLYAGAHHEKLDGTGYPQGLRAEQIPLQARILALADIFEALTALDRPYKKAHTLSQALEILRTMARNHHIDQELLDFFITKRIYQDYAEHELMPWQCDIQD